MGKKGKGIIWFVCLVVLLTFIFVANAKDAPATADDLLKRFEAALRAKDKDVIVELYNWQGVPDNIKKIQQGVIGMMFSQEVKSVKLGPLPEGLKEKWERDGIRSNVETIGVIEIKYVKEGNSARITYGTSNNAYFLAVPITEKNKQSAK